MPALYSTATAGTSSESRLYVSDRSTSTRFLVDSGSVLSIIPKRIVARPLQKQSLVLQAANGTPITTFGTQRLTLDLGLRRPFAWSFVIADVTTAILGADALNHHGLIIDLRGRRLLDGLTSLSTVCALGPTPAVHTVSVISTSSIPEGSLGKVYKQLINEFAQSAALPGEMASLPDLPVQHQIVTNGPPVFARPRRLAGERLTAAKKEFDFLLERGIIRPSSSQWTLSTDQLKPAYLAQADEPQPPQQQLPPQVSSPPSPLQQPVPDQLRPGPQKRVTFSLPSPPAKVTGEGIAVAPPATPSAVPRSRRKQALVTRQIFS